MKKVEIQKKMQESQIELIAILLGIIGIGGVLNSGIVNMAKITALIGFVLAVVIFRKKMKLKKNSLITVAALVITTLSVILSFSSLNDSVKENAELSLMEQTGLDKQLDVVIGEYDIDESRYPLIGQLSVKISSKVNETKNYAIGIEALDSQGNRIASDMIYVEELEANKEEEYLAFIFDDAEVLKEAVKFEMYEITEM